MNRKNIRSGLNGKLIIPGRQVPFSSLPSKQKALYLASKINEVGAALHDLRGTVRALTDFAAWMAALVAVLERRLDMEPGELVEFVSGEVVAQREATAAELVGMEEVGYSERPKGLGPRMLMGSAFPLPPLAPETKEEVSDAGN